MPTKKSKSLKSALKDAEVKKVAIGKGIPDKEPDIKISDDVVTAILEVMKVIYKGLDKIDNQLKRIADITESMANGDTAIPVQVNAFNDSVDVGMIDDDVQIVVKEFQGDIGVAVYNNKNQDFSITGSIDVNGDLTINK